MSAPQPDLTALEEEASELRSRLARLAGERAKIEEDLALTRRRLSQVHLEMARLYEDSGAVPVPAPAAPSVSEVQGRSAEPAPAREKRPYGNAKAAVRVATDILREAGKPMHTLPLLEELRRRGVVVEEPAPHIRLSNWLSKAPEVRSSKSDGWRLAEWPAPPPGVREQLAQVRAKLDAADAEGDWSVDAVLEAADGGQLTVESKRIDRGFIKNLDPERHHMRTLEGLAAAKARGVRLGRLPSVTPEKWAEVKRLLAGGSSLRAAALATGIGPSTVQRRAPELLEEIALEMAARERGQEQEG